MAHNSHKGWSVILLLVFGALLMHDTEVKGPLEEAAIGSAGVVGPHVVCNTHQQSGNWVALTFDDGPDPTYTPQVLAILRQYQIRATFCLVGREVRAYPDLVREIVADGHRLCDHTMTHDEHLPDKSDVRIRWEVLTTLDEIHKVVPGVEVPYYRAPGGNFTRRVNSLVAGWGLQPLGWSVDPRDWSRPGVTAIIKTVDRQLKPCGVILFHDAGGDRSETVAALKQIIPALIAQGYQFDFPDLP